MSDFMTDQLFSSRSQEEGIDSERKARIDAKLAAMEEEKRQKETEEETKYRQAMDTCQALLTRVSALIDTANYLLEHKIVLPDKRQMEKYGYAYTAWAEGFYHGVGFMCFNRPQGWPITHVGIINGGACGVWDLYVNGADVFARHEKNGSVKDPDRRDLEYFAKHFPDFEAAFYGWCDDFCEVTPGE